MKWSQAEIEFFSSLKIGFQGGSCEAETFLYPRSSVILITFFLFIFASRWCQYYDRLINFRSFQCFYMLRATIFFNFTAGEIAKTLSIDFHFNQHHLWLCFCLHHRKEFYLKSISFRQNWHSKHRSLEMFSLWRSWKMCQREICILLQEFLLSFFGKTSFAPSSLFSWQISAMPRQCSMNKTLML